MVIGGSGENGTFFSPAINRTNGDKRINGIRPDDRDTMNVRLREAVISEMGKLRKYMAVPEKAVVTRQAGGEW